MTRTSLWLCVGLAVALMLPCILFAHGLASIFRLEHATTELTATYIRWVSLSAVPFAVAMVIATALRSAGDTRTPLYILLVSTQDAADPNKTNASVVKDKKGTAFVSIITTLIGFEASDNTIYRFHKVSRDGITGVRYHAPGKKGPEVHPLPK